MSTITDVIWEIVTDNDELHSELTKIMQQTYEPFTLSQEKATTVNTLKLESYILEEVEKWYEWFPERPIGMLGGEWAMEALRQGDWRYGASLILDELQGAGVRRGSRHDQATAQKRATAALHERIHLIRLLTAAITRATLRKLAGVSTAVVKAFLHAERGRAQECH